MPVANAAPRSAQALPPQAVEAGETSAPLNLARYFTDPDGDPLRYAAASGDVSVAIADLPRGSSRLVLHGVGAGQAIVTVTASDPWGASASQRLTVTVTAVTPTSAVPVVVQRIAPQTVMVGEAGAPLDLAHYFRDPRRRPAGLLGGVVRRRPARRRGRGGQRPAHPARRGGRRRRCDRDGQRPARRARQPAGDGNGARQRRAGGGAAAAGAAHRAGGRGHRAAGPGAVLPRPGRRPAGLRRGVGRPRRARRRGGGGRQPADPARRGAGRRGRRRDRQRPLRRARQPGHDGDGAHERRARGGAAHPAAERGGRRGDRAAGPGGVFPRPGRRPAGLQRGVGRRRGGHRRGGGRPAHPYRRGGGRRDGHGDGARPA